MTQAAPSHRTIKINRARVLTLWAAVVAQRAGFEWEKALTLGRAVAGLNAYAKGVGPNPVQQRHANFDPTDIRADADAQLTGLYVSVTPITESTHAN